MKKTESKEFRNLLLGLRSRLRGDVSALADAALRKTRSEASGDLSSMPIHMADVGSDAFEQEFTLSLMEHDGSALEAAKKAFHCFEPFHDDAQHYAYASALVPELCQTQVLEMLNAR